MMRQAFAIVGLLWLVGCASAGPWGHAPDYAPLQGEADATEQAREFDPVMAQREPDEWMKGTVRMFAVVLRGKQGGEAASTLQVGVRKLSARNLCSGPEDDTCRVTVSDRDFATIRVSLEMTPEDKVGTEAMSSGSLLRLVGVLKRDPEQPDKLLLQAIWHRHWPRGAYVTEAFRDEMRR
jgi:hypothetical protein